MSDVFPISSKPVVLECTTSLIQAYPHFEVKGAQNIKLLKLASALRDQSE